MSVADILERAADRLSKPGAWTQDELARDAEGKAVGPLDPAAVCWCMSGAIIAECPDAFAEWQALGTVSSVLPKVSEPILTYNDQKRRTQAEVVAKLCEAAAKAREQGR